MTMKVAMIGLRGLDDGLGGVEKVVRELSTRLVRAGVEVTCYCRNRYSRETEHRGVRVVNLPTLYTKQAETAVYATLAHLRAAASDADLVHVHATGSMLPAWISRWGAGKHLVATVHSEDWKRAKWGALACGSLRLAERCAAHLTDATICVSESLRRELHARYPCGKFMTIRNGSDGVPPTPPRPADLPRPYVLYMGRLVPEKNVHRLIAAFRRVDADAQLVIAGPAFHVGDYEDRLKALAAGDDRIRFIGPITGERKEGVLAHATLFALPSDLEGMPLAPLEAAGRGVCLLLADIPPMREIVGEDDPAGILVDVRRPAALRDAIADALAQPDRTAALARRAHDRVTRLFDWDKAARRTLALYTRLLSRTRP